MHAFANQSHTFSGHAGHGTEGKGPRARAQHMQGPEGATSNFLLWKYLVLSLTSILFGKHDIPCGFIYLLTYVITFFIEVQFVALLVISASVHWDDWLLLRSRPATEESDLPQVHHAASRADA